MFDDSLDQDRLPFMNNGIIFYKKYFYIYLLKYIYLCDRWILSVWDETEFKRRMHVQNPSDPFEGEPAHIACLSSIRRVKLCQVISQPCPHMRQIN